MSESAQLLKQTLLGCGWSLVGSRFAFEFLTFVMGENLETPKPNLHKLFFDFYADRPSP